VASLVIFLEFGILMSRGLALGFLIPISLKFIKNFDD
jgi:hypothetical protein